MRKKRSSSSSSSAESEDSGSVLKGVIDPQGRTKKKCRMRQISPTLRREAHGNLPLVILEDFYKARKPREYRKVSPTLRSDRMGLKIIRRGNIYPSKGEAGQIISDKGISPTVKQAKRGGMTAIPIVSLDVSGQTTTTNTPAKFTDTSLEIKDWLREIFGKSTLILFPILTCSPLASLAKASQSLDSVKASRTQEELFSLKSAGWLRLRNPDGFYLKTLKDYSAMMEAEHSKSSSPHWMNWGMTVNGKCLTLRLGYPRTGKGSLSLVLEEKVDEKYYLNQKAINRTLQMPQIANAVDPDGYLRATKRARKDGKSILVSLCQKRIRRLTPTECERLQGFPDFFTSEGIDSDGNKVKISDTQRYKMMGNALSIPVIEAIGKRLAQGVL